MPTLLSRLRASVKSVRSVLSPQTGERRFSFSVLDMLIHNWYLGLTSFGGPAVHFQIFRRRFVEKYAWLDEPTYQEMFALCQALSGPGSTKMLYGINVMRYGFGTGLLAFVVWSLPMSLVAFGLGLAVGRIQTTLPDPVYALLSGLNSATVGIVALAAYQLSQKAITDTPTRLLVFFGGSAGMLYNALWYFPVLMVFGATTTILWDLKVPHRLLKRDRSQSRDVTESQAEGQTELAVQQTQDPSAQGTHDSNQTVRSRTTPHHASKESLPPPTTSPHESSSHDSSPSDSKPLIQTWKVGLAILLAFFLSFIIIMVLRGVFHNRARAFDLFANLYLAGTIIFGGGPVVIPLLRSYTVDPGWVSPRDFLLGLALIQSLPGPNFGFAVFLGTLAVPSAPALGGLIGYVSIFTPGLWIHTSFIGLWSSIRKYQVVRAALRGVHASAVGLVFTAVYRLFVIGYLDADTPEGGSLMRDPWWVVIVATSFVGGLHFRLSPPGAIVVGAVMGLIWYGVVQA